MAEEIKTVNAEELPAPLLQFPCEFPMKIVGEKSDNFAQSIVSIIQKYQPDFNPASVEMKQSGKGNYLSLGVLINATSQEMLDNIYREVTKQPGIKFVL